MLIFFALQASHFCYQKSSLEIEKGHCSMVWRRDLQVIASFISDTILEREN